MKREKVARSLKHRSNKTVTLTEVKGRSSKPVPRTGLIIIVAVAIIVCGGTAVAMLYRLPG